MEGEIFQMDENYILLNSGILQSPFSCICTASCLSIPKNIISITAVATCPFVHTTTTSIITTTTKTATFSVVGTFFVAASCVHHSYRHLAVEIQETHLIGKTFGIFFRRVEHQDGTTVPVVARYMDFAGQRLSLHLCVRKDKVWSMLEPPGHNLDALTYAQGKLCTWTRWRVRIHE